MEIFHEKHYFDICRRPCPVRLPCHAERMHTKRHPAAERVTPSLVAIPSGIARRRRRRHRYTTVYRAAGRQRIGYPNCAQQRSSALGCRRSKKSPPSQIPAGHLPRQTHCGADTSIVHIQNRLMAASFSTKAACTFCDTPPPQSAGCLHSPAFVIKMRRFLAVSLTSRLFRHPSPFHQNPRRRPKCRLPLF